MKIAVAIALALVAVWAILTVALDTVGVLINLILLAAIIILAWWAYRRLA